MPEIFKEVREGIGYIWMDIPKVNVLCRSHLENLAQFVEESKEKVLVLGSKRKIFSAGMAIEDHLPDKVEAMFQAFTRLAYALLDYPGVTAALVNQAAYGGGTEIALCCDLLFATPKTEFSQPEIQLAVFPPIACALYPLKMPPHIAHEMIFSGKAVTAEEWKSLGVVNQILENLEEEAPSLLTPYLEFSLPALKLAKKALLWKDLVKDRLEKANQIYLKELMGYQDPLEGLKAFMEKRKPIFKDA
ncbi:MAG: hypothetical protein D6785_14860 [Planctomycetota bacterium]|nr:MAG: hypothetical protein D6785_14860 [Planctomycetota bacterium]